MQVRVVVDLQIAVASDGEIAVRLGVVPLAAEADLGPSHRFHHWPTHSRAGVALELPLSRTITTSTQAFWTPGTVTVGSGTRATGWSAPRSVRLQSKVSPCCGSGSVQVNVTPSGVC